MSYLKSPYVLLGVLGIAYYVYKRKKIIALLPKTSEIETESVISEIKNKVDDFSDIPESFKNQIKKMSANDIGKTIKSNQEMLSRKKLDKDEQEGVLRMLEYLRKEQQQKKQ